MATETPTDVGPRGENFYLHALLGAVVTVVTSFVPFSPIVGGAVAGYLHDEGTGPGTRVGLVAGIVAAIPLAAVFLVLFTVMSLGVVTSGEFAGPMFVVVLVGTILLFAALYVVGLSAAGGYVGAAFAESQAEKRVRRAEATTLDDYASPGGEDDSGLDADDATHTDAEDTSATDEEPRASKDEE